MSHSDNDGNKDDRVGYGRPPKQSRFKKGQSGNPKGSSKKRRGSHEPLALSRGRVAKDILTEMDLLMCGPVEALNAGPKNLPVAAILARLHIRDALTKEGRSRQQLLERYTESAIDVARQLLENGKSPDGNGPLMKLARAMYDPTVDEEEMERIVKEMGEEEERQKNLLDTF